MQKQIANPSIPAWTAFVIGLGLIAFFGSLDYITGAELAFSIFYLIPISLVTWQAGYRHGLAMVLLASATWLISDILTHDEYSNALIPYWNASVRFGFFMIVCYMLNSLRQAMEREKETARTDSLTGACNSRAFMEFAEQELERSRRDRKPLTLAYLDCDNFKTVNDTLGHNMGNTLLIEVAQIMKSCVRPYDIVARLGGDEFAVLFPGLDAKECRAPLERLLSELNASMQFNKWPVSFSIGAVTFSHPPSSVNDMIKAADALMYEVKNGGKNGVLHQTV